MVRLLTLAVLAGFAAFWATSTVAANDGATATAPAAAVSQAPAVAVAPAPAAAPVRVAAPRRSYRTYSYSPTNTNRVRGYRSRAYAYGVRDAASKSLGVNQPFNR